MVFEATIIRAIEALKKGNFQIRQKSCLELCDIIELC